MYSILLNSKNQELSYSSFYNKFLQICQEHKDSNEALAFAFILYDFENAQISKILKDTDYWLSLNAISGKYLTVFSLHFKSKIGNKRNIGYETGNPIFYNLASVPHFDNPSIGSNSLIEKYFGQNIQVNYPAVMFFQVHHNEIIDYRLIELDELEIEPAFIELRNYIAKAVEVLKKITEENKQNSKEIFKLVDSQIKGLRTKIVAKKVVKRVSSLLELASSVLGLVG